MKMSIENWGQLWIVNIIVWIALLGLMAYRFGPVFSLLSFILLAASAALTDPTIANGTYGPVPQFGGGPPLLSGSMKFIEITIHQKIVLVASTMLATITDITLLCFIFLKPR